MKSLPRFESKSDYVFEHENRIAELKKFGTSESKNLAHLLKNCISESLSESAACPGWRAWRSIEVEEWIDQQPRVSLCSQPKGVNK
jgi:hypothetical protein